MSKSIIIFIITLIFPVQSSAVVFDIDDRINVENSVGSPYGPIGVVFSSKRDNYTTGFLVSQCDVLTVRHILNDNFPAKGRYLYFSVGPKTIKGKWISRGTVVASGDFIVGVAETSNRGTRIGDWLLLHLDDCLGKKFGFLDLSISTGAESLNIQSYESAGFPRDRPLTSGVTLDPSCKIRVFTEREVLHDCASRPGNSGSPIFREVVTNGKMKLEVYAMHSGGVSDAGVRPFDATYLGVALPTRTLLPSIKPYLSDTNPA